MKAFFAPLLTYSLVVRGYYGYEDNTVKNISGVHSVYLSTQQTKKILSSNHLRGFLKEQIFYLSIISGRVFTIPLSET
jgi:hypothetical protein